MDWTYIGDKIGRFKAAPEALEIRACEFIWDAGLLVGGASDGVIQRIEAIF